MYQHHNRNSEIIGNIYSLLHLVKYLHKITNIKAIMLNDRVETKVVWVDSDQVTIYDLNKILNKEYELSSKLQIGQMWSKYYMATEVDSDTT